MGKKKPPICNVGDRILTPGGKSVGIVEHTSYTSIKPYKIRWDNGLFGIYSAKDFDKYGYKIHPSQALPEVEETPAQIPLDFSRDQKWREGDRVTALLDSDWQPGELIVLDASDPENIKVKAADYEIYSVVDSRSLRAWNSLKPADCLRDKEASPVQLSLLEDLIGKSQLKTTKTRSRCLNQTSSIKFGEETSETSTQTEVNTICSVEDFPVQTPVEPETELELLTYLQSLEQCSASSSDALEKPDPSSSFWSNLRDLSIEDLERGLEDSSWEDIKASIQSSRVPINLERSSRESDCLSFPTLLSGRGKGCRDAGLVECEKWWKANVIQEIGLQLSAEAIACLHGFPSTWYRSISPPSVARQGTQAGLQPENSEAKPSPSPKLELPLSGLNGCTKSLRVKTSELLRLLNWEEEQLDEYWDGQSFVASGYSIRWLGATANRWEIEAIARSRSVSKRSTPVELSESLQIIVYGDSQEFSLEKSESLTEKERRWWVGDRLIGSGNTGKIIESTDKEVVIVWRNNKGGRCSERYSRHQLKDLSDFQYEELSPTKERDSRQIGSLYWYTKNVADKTGTIQTYPKWDGIGERPKPQQLVKNDEVDRLWYWGYSYIEKSLGKWRDKSAAVPRKKLSAVRDAIADGKPYTYILQEVLGKD
ncbi:MAG TPA: hypothetical protein V6C85_26680 [Allocoleopsis sp.]